MKTKPECPEIIKYPEMDYCKLSDKPCYLERGWECKIWECAWLEIILDNPLLMGYTCQ